MNIFLAKPYIFKKTRPLIVILIVASLVHNFFLFPVQAAMDDANINSYNNRRIMIIKNPDSEIKRIEQLSAPAKSATEIDFTLITAKEPTITEKPKISLSYPQSGRQVSLTAYNSEAAQTDGDPCTTANGFNVCQHGVEDTVAANFLPMGTKLKIPALFGDKVFVVRDRMNRRHTNRVDVWMLKKSDAIKFGVRHAEIVVVD